MRTVAQLAVWPAVVLLSETSRIADFQVRNESNSAQEVTIGFRFGYAQSDASGRPVMIYDESVAAREAVRDGEPLLLPLTCSSSKRTRTTMAR